MTQNRVYLAAVFCVSAAALLLEIALTNLLSSIYLPPDVFVVISMAILGTGIGAALVAGFSVLRNIKLLPAFALIAGLSTAFIAIFAVSMPTVNNARLLLFIFINIPYIAVGLFFSTLFALQKERSSILYMADLVGAGAGALLAILIMDLIGATNSILAASLLFGLVTLFLSAGRRFYPVLFVNVLLAGAVALNLAAPWLALDMASLDKPISETLRAGGEIIATREDAFARTDVVAPTGDAPLRIYVDGAAASIMPRAGRDTNLIRDIGFFPFIATEPENVFVIGPGAGLDIWFGLQMNPVPRMTGVEVNTASVELVNEFAAYNGNLYRQPDVTTLVDEGRSVLRRSDEQYDLIFLSQVVTLVAERSGFALTENTIYTLEAFREYLAHLSRDGVIALKLYDEITLTRAAGLAVAALNERGLTDAEALQHVSALLDVRANPPIPILMIRNTPYQREDAALFAAIADQAGYAPLLLPPVIYQAPLDSVADGSTDFATIIENSSNNLSVSTDNQPYFFQFERGIPKQLQTPLAGIAAAIVAGLILLALFLRHAPSTAARLSPLYFAGIGIGFIAIEVVLIQQLRSILGHPTYAVTVVLVTLLVSAGAGSALSRRLPGNSTRIAPLIVIVVLSAWVLLWLQLSDVLFSQSLAGRTLLVVLSLLIPGMVMGMPFPAGLTQVSFYGDKYVAMAWAVNAVMSVAGVLFAVVVSIVAGFEMVFFMALLAYGLAALSQVATSGVQE